MNVAPTVYFMMNRRSNVPPQRVHDMLRELHRRMGERTMGAVGFSIADHKGGYVIAFEKRETADAFESRYRAAGGTPRRTTQLPRGMVLVSAREVAARHIVEDLTAFLHYICGHPRHKAHLN